MTDVATEAYIAYVKEKGFAPKNASQLVNFAKFRQARFPGIKYSAVRGVISNPPNIDKIKADSENENENENDINAKQEEIKTEEKKEKFTTDKPITKPKKVENKPKKVQVASNPYLDSAVANNFITKDDNKKFMEKYEKPKTKSKIANAYDLFLKELGIKPKNAIQFLGFCESKNLNCAYSECSQYIQFIKKQQPQEDSSDEDNGGSGYATYQYKK